MWTQFHRVRNGIDVTDWSPMPFGCESYVDPDLKTKDAKGILSSPMPFGCESYVDKTHLVTTR